MTDMKTLDMIFEPLGQMLTPAVARKFVAWRLDAKTQSRIDKLARKCNEGQLTDDERREYESFVRAIDFVSILQAKARQLLKPSAAVK
jgi:hypothetical protein